MKHFGDIAFTDHVKAEQTRLGSRDMYAGMTARSAPDGLSEREAAFISMRDSFYMATVTDEGWPYIQHRGGPRGFLKILSDSQIAFADYRGNRQHISEGNLAGDDRVSLFAMDYPRKARMKLQGRATVVNAGDDPDLAARLASEGEGRVERLVTIRLDAFDWNCPQFITPRFDAAELAPLVGPEMDTLNARIAELEAENASLKGRG